MRHAAVVWVGCVLMALPSGGCGPSADELAPVRGRVHYQGEPLAGGLIVFTPDPGHGESGPVSTARIESDGSYRLETRDGEGAMPGWHRVSIAAAPRRPGAPPSLALPRRYRQPELSGLCREIVPGKENVLDFDLAGP